MQVRNYTRHELRRTVTANFESTYACLADVALAQLVEVDEELFDSDAVLQHQGLHSLLHIKLDVQVLLSVLLG